MGVDKTEETVDEVIRKALQTAFNRVGVETLKGRIRKLVDYRLQRLAEEGVIDAYSNVSVTCWEDVPEREKTEILLRREHFLKSGAYWQEVNEEIDELVAGYEVWLVRVRWSCSDERMDVLMDEFADENGYIDWEGLEGYLASGKEPTAYQFYKDPGPPESIIPVTMELRPVEPVNYIEMTITL